MLKSDGVRLLHMLDAAAEALAFADGRSRNALDGDRVLVLARVKSIEIVGEAAANVSDACRKDPPPTSLGRRSRE